ncbi:cobalamin B12-binding domain-containing protein [Streptomyces sp. NPDC058464]|uniref:cobalamin B12-binding domain-containing protein n=1 Tax=Streptomyces sp. NPDC058464 TaxID=3346511 RepID=UPI00365DC4CF
MELGKAERVGLDVVVSTMASDAHTWNLVFLQLLLEELGHRVTNLGACVPDAELIAECRRLAPDLIVLSSVNGHGFIDARRVVPGLRACPELLRTQLVIGGKLGITGADDGSVARTLRAAGFDKVFEESASADELRSFVRALSRAVPV